MALANPGAAGKFRLGGVIGDTLSFVGRNPVLALAVAVCFFVLPSILSALLTFAYREKATFLVGGGRVEPFSVTIYVGFLLLAGLLSALPAFLGHAVLSTAVLEDARGHSPSIVNCIQSAFHRLVPVLCIGFTIYLLWFCAQQAEVAAQLLFPTFGGGVAFLLAVVPSIVWVLGSLAAVPVAMREGLGAMASIRRSRALTKGNRWPIFGLFLALFLLTLALRLGLFLGFDLALMAAPAVVVIVNATANSAVTAIAWLLASVTATTTYIALRRAKEGGGVDELVDVFS
ncbi:conserved membrane hypothetical protein [Mesorhizobium sp. ORS 3359]|nr:conserved membrane hypothetical protein [Mesorhizobium sp. ORS 3359]